MHAITLWRPWDRLVVAGYKQIENRPWRLAPDRMGMQIAIHAGQVFDRSCIPLAVSLGVPISFFDDIDRPEYKSAIVGVVTYVGVLPEHTTARWYYGAQNGDGKRNWGWILAQPRALLRPIPCRGTLGLWKVPPDVEQKITEQLARYGGKAA